MMSPSHELLNEKHPPRRRNTYSVKSSYKSPLVVPASEDSDSDEDEKERRKYISLKGGQGFLWFANKFSNQWDLTNHEKHDFFTDCNLDFHHRKSQKLQRNHNGRHSLRQIKNQLNPPISLDNIQISNEFEYGFNHLRISGSKANMAVKMRPISLFSPPSERPKSMINHSEQKKKYAEKNYDSTSFLKKTVSYAKNDFEAFLEQEVLTLRARPSNLNIHGCKGNTNDEELVEDLKNARLRRFVKRQLSFDSHPRKKLSKTLSLESVLTNERHFKSFPYRVKNDNSFQSEELLDLTNDFSWAKDRSSKCKSIEFLSFSADDNIDADATVGGEEIVSVGNAKDFSTEHLVISSEKYVEEKEELKEKKRRPSIPHLLSSFKLPSKNALKKFIRKKHHTHQTDSLTPVKVSHNVVSKNAIDKNNSKPVKDSIGLLSGNVRSAERTCAKDVPVTESSSVHSLARVDEEKETFEFTEPLERRSCSSCSISKNTHASPSSKETLERRMSDTALSWNEKLIGCSPGRKFVRRLLSPVVCGLPSPDRYAVPFNDSLHSLASCDTASISSDSELSCPFLFDFSTHELSDELTLIDKELLIRISWEELSKCGWMSHDKFVLAPNVMKMVQFFNRTAMMVTTCILLEPTPYRRSKVIRKAIKLACRCRYMKNYNSLKAVLSGMQCTPIFRLKSTWKQVPSRYRRMFRELSEAMSESNNFGIYQQELATAVRNPPFIPFLGNFLTAVAHTHAYMAVHNKTRALSETKEPIVGASLNHETTLSCSSEAINGSTNHSRTDSDDSGVVLHRLSHVSDDGDMSPRESCLSSPDEEEHTRIEEVFEKKTNHSPVRKCASHDYIAHAHDNQAYRKSVSMDSGKRFSVDINYFINKKPVEPEEKDPLYDCEVQFWNFQISSVQYSMISRPYLRRYLINSPFNTEEENYKLSLEREPPST